MKMNFNFDGKFRRAPQQNLAGFSIETDRQTLIQRAQIERRKREESRQKENAAQKIQSLLRSWLSRQHIRKRERQVFENYLRSNGLNNFSDLEFLLKRFLFFYDLRDGDKLVLLSQFIIKNIQSLFQILLQPSEELARMQWIFRVQRLLVLCIRQILATPTSIAIPMRIIEIFTSFESIKRNIPAESNDQEVVKFLKHLFSYLIDQKYFESIRKMLNEKIPENTYDEVSLRPHNEISRVLLEMIKRPLKLVNTFNADSNFDPKILASFATEILTKEFTSTISNFIVPSLGSESDFPFIKLLKFLHDLHVQMLRAEGFPYNNNNYDEISPFKKNHKGIKFNGYLLYTILKLDSKFLDEVIRQDCLSHYLVVIGAMIGNISKLPKPNQPISFSCNFDDGDDLAQDSSDSEDENDLDTDMQPQIERLILSDTILLLNEQIRDAKIVKNLDGLLYKPEVVHSICLIVHNLMIYNRAAINEYRLLDMLAFKPEFIRTLWYTLLTTKSHKNQLSISILSKGIQIPQTESCYVIPILATFCALFGRLLSTLHDGEFFYCNFDVEQESMGIDSNVEQIQNKVMPFHIKDVSHMCLTLKELAIGLVELAFPETRSALKDHYKNIFSGTSDDDGPKIARINQEKAIWSQLLKVTVSLLRQLHTRDLRCDFCPPDNWIAPTLNIPLDRPNDLHFSSRRRGPRPFKPIRDFTRKNLDEGPPLSTKQIRSITILKEIPFVVPFNKRFEVLQGLLAAEKLRSQGDMQGFLQGPQTYLTVRRTHLYEDAFDKLSPENEPNLRSRFRVQMINQHQLEEAGIDGGGIFREFLSELIKRAFDPNRGFFILTHDNMLYPNPSASVIQENFQKHYYFIGRMLGKALFENLLVELPLAEFFLSKLAGRQADIIDIHQLQSLDPDMHKNLMKLKSYDEEDFTNLELDFTVVCDDLGETRVVELKPNGANIPVNSSNWIEYISAMADFKLNRQIRDQCQAFRQGLTNVLPISWLYMFNTKELQVLMSGAEIPVDVDDLMKHTRYGGDYTAENKTVKMFWKVVRSLDNDQRRQLLRFVTSCSRPPLLGFKDLDPPFSIQNSGDDLNRLVTASTCLNLLKLPEYTDEDQLREKLLYAIQSGVGFELS